LGTDELLQETNNTTLAETAARTQQETRVLKDKKSILPKLGCKDSKNN
jgi:hypothetical protein